MEDATKAWFQGCSSHLIKSLGFHASPGEKGPTPTALQVQFLMFIRENARGRTVKVHLDLKFASAALRPYKVVDFLSDSMSMYM